VLLLLQCQELQKQHVTKHNEESARHFPTVSAAELAFDATGESHQVQVCFLKVAASEASDEVHMLCHSIV
jgi:hypothetical protein